MDWQQLWELWCNVLVLCAVVVKLWPESQALTDGVVIFAFRICIPLTLTGRVFTKSCMVARLDQTPTSIYLPLSLDENCF